MELNKIEIVNFRSIADITISTNPKCQGFVGINESGKTNVLMAISQLSPEVKLNKDDVRIEGTDEDHDQDSYIEYFFKLSSSDMDEIMDSFESKIYFESALPLLEINNKKVDLKGFFLARDTGLFYCNIAEERKYGRYYRIGQFEDVGVDGLKKVKNSSTSTITMNSGSAVALSKYSFVEAACIPEDKISLFEDCTMKDLNEVFGSIQKTFVEEHLPHVVYWKYERILESKDGGKMHSVIYSYRLRMGWKMPICT